MIGKTLLHYQITGKIGAGGMGEVYRATDTKLGREVAIKVLSPGLADSDETRSRFRREARALAALNHPGIASIHGFEEGEGRSLLVMELVEGETLAARLDRGRLPVSEALRLSAQVAEALAAAHERGILHRDLKPANVKVTPDGRAKLLDFGLAKAFGLETEEARQDDAPTETTPLTREGVVHGTAPYMSPEQARGEELDARSDVWAFGCLLYEALSGRAAFPGETVSDSIAAVLERTPDWSALPADTPVTVRSLLRHCLSKDQSRRLRAAADAQLLIAEALTEPNYVGESPGEEVVEPRRRIVVWMTATAVLAASAGGSLAVWLSHAQPETLQPQRLSIVPPRDAPVRTAGNSGVLAFSDDGTTLVYVARLAPRTYQLYQRRIDDFEFTPIRNTENAVTPFLSPSGQWVGFFDVDSRVLKKVPLRGGAATEIGAGLAHGASWGENDLVLFPRADGGLSLVSPGGAPRPVTESDPGELGYHRWPQILPGGEAALFAIRGPSGREDDSRIAVLTLDTGEWRVLLEGATLARYVPPGFLIYTRTGTAFAVRFDPRTLETSGTAVPVLEDVAMYPVGSAYLAVSGKGALAYVRRKYGPPPRRLVLLDRSGEVESVVAERRGFAGVNGSPDGDRLALEIERAGGMDIWTYDLRRGTWLRLTAEGVNGTPRWSPDGRRIAFSSNRNGDPDLYTIPSNGGAEPERLTDLKGWQYVESWSPDGQRLLFNTQGGGAGWDLWMLSLDKTSASTPYLTTTSNEHGAQFSPNGHWIAFQSDRSGRREVYVRSATGAGGTWPISTDGGRGAVWSSDGKELFFLEGSRMMVASVRAEPRIFRSDPPRVLFEFEADLPLDPYFRPYDVTKDGRFVAVVEDEEAPTDIVWIPDFGKELEARFRAEGQ